MTKKKMICLMAAVLLSITAFSGCSSSDSNNDSSSYPTAIVTGYTYNSAQGSSYYVACEVASTSDLTTVSPANFVTPSDLTKIFQVATGSLAAESYYYSTNINNQGSVGDPFSETTTRQLYTSADITAPINGTYTVNLGTASKEIGVAQTDYMPVINQSDIAVTSGLSNYINVTGGDTIIVSNQNNSNYRYLCRIYDTISGNVVKNYWTSSDVRTLYWTDPETTYNYFAYNLTSPANGQVRFTLPQGVLSAGTQNLMMVISAYDISAMAIDTNGQINSLTSAVSEAYFTYSGR